MSFKEELAAAWAQLALHRRTELDHAQILGVVGLIAALYAWREWLAVARTRNQCGEPDWSAYLAKQLVP
jgi:hypothetical protein